MSTNEIIGTIAVVGVPLVVSIIALIKPIINLNTSITKLNITMEQLVEDNNIIRKELKEHEGILQEHDKQLYLIAHRKE